MQVLKPSQGLRKTYFVNKVLTFTKVKGQTTVCEEIRDLRTWTSTETVNGHHAGKEEQDYRI